MTGDLTLTKPTEPVLTRKRQELVIASASTKIATADWYHLFFKVPQPGLADAAFFKAPDADDQATFRIDELLNGRLDYQLPAFNSDAVVEDTAVLRLVPTTVEERYFEGTEIFNAYTENIWALKAGMGHRLNQTDFHAEFLTAGRFLAFTGRGQRVNPATQLFLSFYLENEGSVNFEVVGMVNLCGGGSVEQVIATYEDLSPGGTKQVFQIPAGFEQTGLNQLLSAGEEPNCFSIKVTDPEGVALSEVFSFDIERRPAKATFIFANSAGGWGTLCCFGHVEEGFGTERASAETLLSADHLPSEAQYVAVPQAGRFSGKAEAGFLAPKERLHFVEFLRSERVLMVTADAFIPVRILNADALLSSTFNPLLPSMIEYEYAFDSAVYDNEKLWL